MSGSKNTVTMSLSLAPTARATLQLLTEVEGSSGSALLTRLLRQELARVAPGAWEAAQMAAAGLAPDLDPATRADEVLRVLRARVG